MQFFAHTDIRQEVVVSVKLFLVATSGLAGRGISSGWKGATGVDGLSVACDAGIECSAGSVEWIVSSITVSSETVNAACIVGSSGWRGTMSSGNWCGRCETAGVVSPLGLGETSGFRPQTV